MISRFLAFTLVCTVFAAFVTPASAQDPVLPGDLIKGSGSAVYFYYGGRYAFPNEAIYSSWYASFNNVKTVSDEFLAASPLVGNVRFKPGSYLVKLTTDPKVYFIDTGNVMRWVKTEADAAAMYGSDWASQVRDLPDTLFADYRIGEAVPDGSDAAVRDNARYAYGEIPAALRDLAPGTPASFESFLRHPSFIGPTTIGPFGYDASSTTPLEDVRSFYLTQSSGWDLLYDDFLETSFGDGHLLNFGQTRNGRFAHRSIAISRTSSTTPRTTVEFQEVEFPEGFLTYPRMATAELVSGKDLLFQQGLTKDHLAEIVAWYKEVASARGWELVSESEAGSLDSFGILHRLYFRVPGKPTWLHVQVTQVGGSFRELTGELSSVVTEYLQPSSYPVTE